MNAAQPVETAGFPVRAREVVLAGLLVGFLVILVGITSFFRLSSETAALRDSALAVAKGPWHKTMALNLGYFTTGIVRWGSHFLNLAAEPQAACDSIRGGEVGIYKLPETAGWVDHGAILARADQAMSVRRWERLVGVSRQHQLVAVYVPRGGVRTDRVRCCVLVLDGRDLVIAAARANLDPLLKIAGEPIDFKQLSWHLALR